METTIQQLQITIVQIEAQLYRLMEQRMGLKNQLGALQEVSTQPPQGKPTVPAGGSTQ